MRRALVAELEQAELILSAMVFNLSIGTDHVADAVQELRWFLQLGTERILRAGVLDLTTGEIEAMRHLQGQSDQGAAEVLRTLSPGQRARPELRVPVLDSLLANPPVGFGHIEAQALRWYGGPGRPAARSGPAGSPAGPLPAASIGHSGGCSSGDLPH